MKDRLKSVMAEAFNINDDQIEETSSIETLAEWDSLAHLKLIVGIEQAFGIQVEEDQIVNLNSFPAILQYLETKIV